MYRGSPLSSVTVEKSIEHFLLGIQNEHTRSNYRGSLQKIQEQFLDPLNLKTLQDLANASHIPGFSVNHFEISLAKLLDRTRKELLSLKGKALAESSREASCACFLTWTHFLERETNHTIRKPLPARTGINQTFSWKRSRTVCEPLTERQVAAFLRKLKMGVSIRAYLFAILMLQGIRRSIEVRLLLRKDIDWLHRKIRFRISKMRNHVEEVWIYYPGREEFWMELRKYIDDTEEIHQKVLTNQKRKFEEAFEEDSYPDLKPTKKLKQTPLQYVFPNSSAKSLLQGAEKPISRSLPHMWFLKGWRLSQGKDNIPNCPVHTLRAYGITRLKSLKVPIDEISRITGHKNMMMINYYNLNEVNVTKDIIIGEEPKDNKHEKEAARTAGDKISWQLDFAKYFSIHT